MSLHRFEVGQPYHPDRTSWPETTQYNYRSGNHELVFFLRRPTSREIEAITRGPAEFALYHEGNLLLLVYRFRTRKLEPAFGWSDAPYAIHRVPETERTPPTDEPGRALLQVFVVDADTGILRGMRALTWDEEFTQAIHAAIRAQAALPWDSAAYDRELRALYARYQSHELVPLAQALSTGGS